MPREVNVIQMELTPPLALRIIKEIAQDSAKVSFTDHAMKRMRARHITTSQVLRCLKHGSIAEGPARGTTGNWEFRMEVFSAGEPIAVAGALDNDGKGNYVIVITTYRP